MLGWIARKKLDLCLVKGARDAGRRYTVPVHRGNATQPAACFLSVINRRAVQNGQETERSDRSRRVPPPPRSIPQSEPVLARLGAADQHAALPVDLDDLAAAHAFRLPLDLVAAAREVGGDLLRDRVLEAQHAVAAVATP